MEVLLNLIWLLVAIAAFRYQHAVWYREASAHRHNGRSSRVLALACALILLFPVISLTDDLHAVQTVMEESSRGVVKARAAAEACLRLGRSSFPALLAALTKPTANSRVVPADLIPPDACLPCLTLISRCEGRSPPLRTA